MFKLWKCVDCYEQVLVGFTVGSSWELDKELELIVALSVLGELAEARDLRRKGCRVWTRRVEHIIRVSGSALQMTESDTFAIATTNTVNHTSKQRRQLTFNAPSLYSVTYSQNSVRTLFCIERRPTTRT